MKMRQNGERPHYYHVICYDLIVDQMRKSGDKLNGADATHFCLTCSQEKKMKKEKKKNDKQHDLAVLRLGIARTSTDEDTFYIKHHRQRLRETKLN